MTTEFKFCRSHKSTVWKVSWAGTPMSFTTSRKQLIFSIHLNAIVLWLIFLTELGFKSFTSLGKEIEYLDFRFQRDLNICNGSLCQRWFYPWYSIHHLRAGNLTSLVIAKADFFLSRKFRPSRDSNLQPPGPGQGNTMDVFLIKERNINSYLQHFMKVEKKTNNF